MAMYGNFVVTSMGKGQLVKENHVFFFRGIWQQLATHGIHHGIHGIKPNMGGYHRYHRKLINRDMKINGKDYPVVPYIMENKKMILTTNQLLNPQMV